MKTHERWCTLPSRAVFVCLLAWKTFKDTLHTCTSTLPLLRDSSQLGWYTSERWITDMQADTHTQMIPIWYPHTPTVLRGGGMKYFQSRRRTRPPTHNCPIIFIYPNIFRFTGIGESGRHSKCFEGWGEFRSVTYEKQVRYTEMYLDSNSLGHSRWPWP